MDKGIEIKNISLQHFTRVRILSMHNCERHEKDGGTILNNEE